MISTSTPEVGLTAGLALPDDNAGRALAYTSLIPFTIGGVTALLGIIIPDLKTQTRYGVGTVAIRPQDVDLEAFAAEVDAKNQHTREACAR